MASASRARGQQNGRKVSKRPVVKRKQKSSPPCRVIDAALVPGVVPGGRFKCLPAGTASATLQRIAYARGSQRHVREGPLLRLLARPPPGHWEPLADEKYWRTGYLPSWILLAGERGPGLSFPALADDPLFWGNNDPCIVPFLPPASKPRGLGSVLVCPGGNYMFLQPFEGAPVARYFAEKLGIPAFVLKYRLLPDAGLKESMADVRAGVREARRHAPKGPLAIIGFSAGGHLAASASSQPGSWWKGQRPDAQILIYPAIDAHEWLDEDSAGFGPNISLDSPQVRSLVKDQPRIQPGPKFVAPPPTFLLSSTTDAQCSAEKNGDLYAQAAMAAKAPLVYMRDDFGDHGFGLKEFWAGACLRWLQSRNFGRTCDRSAPWCAPGST